MCFSNCGGCSDIEQGRVEAQCRDALAASRDAGVVVFEFDIAADAIEDGDQLEPGLSVTTEDMMAMFQVNNENLLAITTDIKGLTPAEGAAAEAPPAAEAQQAPALVLSCDLLGMDGAALSARSASAASSCSRRSVISSSAPPSI